VHHSSFAAGSYRMFAYTSSFIKDYLRVCVKNDFSMAFFSSSGSES